MGDESAVITKAPPNGAPVRMVFDDDVGIGFVDAVSRRRGVGQLGGHKGPVRAGEQGGQLTNHFGGGSARLDAVDGCARQHRFNGTGELGPVLQLSGHRSIRVDGGGAHGFRERPGQRNLDEIALRCRLCFQHYFTSL